MHGNMLFYFSRKNNVHSVQSHSQPTQSCTYTTYKTTEEFTVYSYSKKKLLCCILSSVAVWPQHLIHITSNVFPGQAAGEILPSMAIPAIKSISCYISTCVLHSLENRYTRLWISVIHFPSPGRKKFLNSIEEWRIWREINN